jgi:hypothetical protein
MGMFSENSAIRLGAAELARIYRFLIGGFSI